jgi:hypothetical protein
MKILLLFFWVLLSLLIISCTDSQQKPNENEITNNSFVLDTSRYSIILKDTLTKVSNDEVQSIYKVLKRIIDSINKAHINRSPIDIARYKFQVVPLKSKGVQKLFWVNSFCDSENLKWKEEIYLAKDGGECFFNTKINLTNLTYFDLVVNDSA